MKMSVSLRTTLAAGTHLAKGLIENNEEHIT